MARPDRLQDPKSADPLKIDALPSNLLWAHDVTGLPHRPGDQCDGFHFSKQQAFEKFSPGANLRRLWPFLMLKLVPEEGFEPPTKGL